MRIKLLGTAAAEGFPAIYCVCPACLEARRKGGPNIRTRSGAIIDEDLKLDYGPDTMAHVYAHNLRLDRMRYLLVTHSHEDHFTPWEFFTRRPGFSHLEPGTPPVAVYGNAKVGSMLRPADLEPVDGVPAWTFTEVRHGETYEMGDYRVTAVHANHDPAEACMVYVIQKEGRTLLYGHDSGCYSEASWEVLRRFRFDCVIMDCTFGPLSHEDGHMGFPQNRQIRERMLREGMAGEKTVFVSTHYSHNGLADYDEMVRLAQGSGILISYDGMEIQV